MNEQIMPRLEPIKELPIETPGIGLIYNDNHIPTKINELIARINRHEQQLANPDRNRAGQI